MLRIADHAKHLELSAFFIIVRYTYRNRGTLKFSALIRAMITEATIYFLAMIALQMYVQLSLIFMKVQSLGPCPIRGR